ncbi:MAG: 50S ribosomal protein L9 [Planctomycetota bacterium]
MELLLKRDISSLGKVGEVVTVKPGYARNYLLPMGFAIPVTKANLAEIEAARAVAFAAEQERVAELKQQAEALAEASVTIEGRANDDGHLFGSVAAADIASALKEKGLNVDPKAVRLENPLKEIGVYDVLIHLHADVEVEMKVWVVQAKPE